MKRGTRELPPYVSRFEGSNGKIYYRYRRSGVSFYLPDIRTDPAEFWRKYAEAEATPPKKKTPGKRSLAAAAERYFRTTKYADLREISQQAMRRRIGWLVDDFGTYNVSNFDRRTCNMILDEHRDKPGRREDYRRALMTLMKQAIEEGWIEHNPAALTKRSRSAGKAAKRWPPEVLAKYRAHYPLGTVQRLAFEIFLWTTQRSRDGYAMTVDHVLPPAPFSVPGLDGEATTINLPRLSVVQSKTGAELIIPMHPAIGAALQACPPKGKFLLETRSGEQRAWKAGNMWFNKSARTAIGESGYTTHGLRRSAASIGAEEGLGDKAIAGFTGHKGTAELNRYTRAAEQERLAAGAVGAFVSADRKLAALAAAEAAAKMIADSPEDDDE